MQGVENPIPMAQVASAMNIKQHPMPDGKIVVAVSLFTPSGECTVFLPPEAVAPLGERLIELARAGQLIVGVNGALLPRAVGPSSRYTPPKGHG